MLLKITLKCTSMRVVLNFLNQILNVDVMWSFHCRMLQSWNVEVDVVELVVRVDAMSRFSSRANCFFTVCALELFCSTGCPVASWKRLTRMFSDSLSSFTDLSEKPSSSCKPFSSISWERDVSPFTTNTFSVLSCFPDRSQIRLVFGWVSWENVVCWTFPQDCWTSLPPGCCSIVEPYSSFPLVQSWSCRHEIFGVYQKNMYDFSYNTFPVNLTTFGTK